MAKKKKCPRPKKPVARFVARLSSARHEVVGRHHNLQAIRDNLNVRYFRGQIEARIRWGRHSRQRPRSRDRIYFGSYSSDDKLITIHRSLDRQWIPRSFVEWVVYHEMLHQRYPPRRQKSRRVCHHAEFVAAEAAFPGHQASVKWERANLNRLLFF